MSRAVDGRVNSVFFLTTLPPWKVVTVTLATGVTLVDALRVRFLGVVVLGVAGALAVGINRFCVFTLSLYKKRG